MLTPLLVFKTLLKTKRLRVVLIKYLTIYGQLFLAPVEGCSLQLQRWGPLCPVLSFSGEINFFGGVGILAVGSWLSVGGMWPNYLGAVIETGIRCPHQLVVWEEKSRHSSSRISKSLNILCTDFIFNPRSYFMDLNRIRW